MLGARGGQPCHYPLLRYPSHQRGRWAELASCLGTCPSQGPASVVGFGAVHAPKIRLPRVAMDQHRAGAGGGGADWEPKRPVLAFSCIHFHLQTNKGPSGPQNIKYPGPRGALAPNVIHRVRMRRTIEFRCLAVCPFWPTKLEKFMCALFLAVIGLK